jgi:bifunctional non-homologous end joining protein LigD
MDRHLNPVPLRSRTVPFDHPDWLFELKYDGFRALACIENGRCRLVSRNGHRFSTFSDLEKWIEASVPTRNAVLDGEIVCVDDTGRPQFADLLFHRGDPCFFSFDLLIRDGYDWRSATLMDRKQELRRLLAGTSGDVPVKYADHVEGAGIALFERVRELDLEGIVGKYKYAPYGTSRDDSTWYKIRNRDYSQMHGREQLFERDRHREPVAGWHSCELACADLEQAYASA